MKQREKDERRALRKQEKVTKPRRDEGVDPDLEGLTWGPQPPLY